MKSGFYYTNPEREKSIKMFKILFKGNFTIKLPKNAIIIITMIFHDFPMSALATQNLRKNNKKRAAGECAQK